MWLWFLPRHGSRGGNEELTKGKRLYLRGGGHDRTLLSLRPNGSGGCIFAGVVVNGFRFGWATIFFLWGRFVGGIMVLSESVKHFINNIINE